MVDPQNRFVFVHIPKTAGQSVASFLKNKVLSPRQRVVQRVRRHIGRRTKYDHYRLYRGGGHGRADQIRDAIGAEAFAAAFSFAFVRNPWDRMYSLYKFEGLHPKRLRYKLARDASFEVYLEHILDDPIEPQLDYILDENGQQIVDFVGRFETLTADFETICTRLGFKADLPHKNASGAKNYQKHYTPKAESLVRELCAIDIEHFGYAFS